MKTACTDCGRESGCECALEASSHFRMVFGSMVFSISGAIALMATISGGNLIVMTIFAVCAVLGAGIFGVGCVERLRLQPAQLEQQVALPPARLLETNRKNSQ